MNDMFTSLMLYLHELKKLKKASTIRGGYFYAYKYFFHKTYPYEELKFYDWYPLIFCFGIRQPEVNFTKDSGQYFYGLNLHHIPVAARRYWLSRVKQIASKQFETGGYKILPIRNYEQLLKAMKKAKIGVRKYRFEAVKDLRKVSLDEIDGLMEWYSKTYYGVTINEIQARYRNFKP